MILAFAAALSLFAHVNCVAADQHSSTILDAYVAYAPEDLVQEADGSFALSASQVEQVHTTVADGGCSAIYSELSAVDSDGQPIYADVDRGWNAIAVTRKPSVIKVRCAPASALEVFDSKAAWIDAQYETVSNNDQDPFYVSNRSCFLDRFN